LHPAALKFYQGKQQINIDSTSVQHATFPYSFAYYFLHFSSSLGLFHVQASKTWHRSMPFSA